MAVSQYQIFVYAALLNVCLAGFVRADETNNDFDGPLEIPEVARYYRLPTRLFLQPEFQDVQAGTFLPGEFIDVFTRVLDGDYDIGLHQDAAQSLERVAKEGLADRELYLPALRSRIKKSDSRLVLSACALALIAADDRESAKELAALCRPDNEVLCSYIEPKLAEWKSDILQQTWRQRLQAPTDYTSQLVILACQCLAETGDTASVESLVALFQNDTERFSVRKAAAAATALLDHRKAAECAELLAGGPIQERLLAVTLLSTAQQPNALTMLSQLCDDSEKAIAAVAWEYLEQQDQQRLVEKLKVAVNHPEPNVRKVAVKVMKQIPSDLHNDFLNQMLNDEHIFVRNHAREALDHVASTQSELRTRILENAGSVLADPESTWQSLEQSMLILGRQRHAEYHNLCLPLLAHQRNEVLVTAGWLLHLMPRDELAKPLVKLAVEQFEFLATKATLDNHDHCMARSNQLMYLFHHAAYTSQIEINDVSQKMFDKKAPVHPETRASGIWALASVFAGQTNEKLRTQLSERLHDDNPNEPEAAEVKQASALSLGILGMKEAIPDLELAHTKYGLIDKLAVCIRSALRMLGKNPPDAPAPVPYEIGNWPISPSSSRN